MIDRSKKPRLAVFKFTSCSGCQLPFLNMETEILDLAETVEVAYFAMAGASQPGPYDLAFVEGGISCQEDVTRIQKVRQESKILVAIGNCAVYGGPQALRNFLPLEELKRAVYPQPELIHCFPTCQGIADYVTVDGFLNGCPVDQGHLQDYIVSVMLGKAPEVSTRSVCLECKMKENVCLIVAEGVACMGVLTSSGCGALCPSFDRGCYGCFGPSADPNPRSFANLCRELGLTEEETHRKFRSIVNNAEAFREEAKRHVPQPVER
ncbi:MAG: oxidoreductase [Thermacetogeniaceae bacterium]